MAFWFTMIIVYGIFSFCATPSSTKAFFNGNSSNSANISENRKASPLFEENVSHSANVYGYGNENDTNDNYDKDYGNYRATPEETIIILVILGLVLLVGITGNILVMIIIVAVKSMQTIVNKCLFSLAVADLIILCFLPIRVIIDELTDHTAPLSAGMCHFLNCFDRGACVCSVLIFYYVTIDRYFAVCHPLKSRALWTGRKAYVILLSIWIVSFASSYPYFHVNFFEIVTHKNITYYECYYMVEPWFTWYDTVFNVLIYYLLSFVLVILYGRMIYRIKGSVPKSGSGREGDNVTGRRGRSQVVVLLLVVVVVYIVTQLPTCTIAFLSDFFPELFTFGLSKREFTISMIFQILVFINSAANPVIYFSLSTNFRQGFLQVFHCLRRKGLQNKPEET